MFCGVFELMSLREQVEVYVILPLSREDLPLLPPSVWGQHLPGTNINSIIYFVFYYQELV